MRLSAPIHHLKRQAKLLSRERGVPLHQALDHVAVDHGFKRWSHLTAASQKPSLSQRIFDELANGDMLLLAARPGHGKTLLGLEIAALAGGRGMKGLFFTLDYTEKEAAERLRGIENLTAAEAASVVIDASDDICADYVVEKLQRAHSPAVCVIDYLQLLDQRRSTPVLDDQLAALQRHATRSGDIIVAISQVDRAFEGAGRSLPDLSDIRLPNPADLRRFNKTCFLHDGAVWFAPSS